MKATNERLSAFWSVHLPLAVRRVWPRYAAALVEGHYLAAWPRIGAWAPMAALAFGFITGWWHLGHQYAFTESRTILVSIAAMSFLSPQLGALALAGYVTGDFLMFRPSYFQVANMFLQSTWRGLVSDILWRLSFVIYYSMLAILTVYLPLLTQSLARHTFGASRSLGPVDTILEAALHGTVAGVLTYFWAQAVPILIRPIWTWQGSSPSTIAIAPLQADWWIPVAAAAVAAVGRVILEVWTRAHYREAVENLQRQTASAIGPGPLTAKVNHQVRILGSALFTTFLLSGMVTRWWEALLLALVFAALNAFRSGLYFHLPGPWVDMLSRVPLVVRLGAAVIVGWFLSSRVIAMIWSSAGGSFLPIIAGVVVCLIIIVLLCPDEAGGTRRVATVGGKQ